MFEQISSSADWSSLIQAAIPYFGLSLCMRPSKQHYWYSAITDNRFVEQYRDIIMTLLGAIMYVIASTAWRVATRQIAKIRNWCQEWIASSKEYTNGDLEIEKFAPKTDVDEWLARVERYIKHFNIASDELKVNIVLEKMPFELKRQLRSLYKPNDDDNYGVITYFLRTSQNKNESQYTSQTEFDNRKQQRSENLQTYYLILSDLADKAYRKEVNKSAVLRYVRDRFTNGLRSQELKTAFAMHNPEVTDPVKVVAMAAELERQLAVVKPMMSEKKEYYASSSDKNESSSQGEQQSTEH